MKRVCGFIVLFLWVLGWGQDRIPIFLSAWQILSGEVEVNLRLEFATNVVERADIASMKAQFENRFFLDFSPKLKYTLSFVDEKTVNIMIVDKLLPARRYYLTVKTTDPRSPKATVEGKPLSYNVPVFFETPRLAVVQQPRRGGRGCPEGRPGR